MRTVATAALLALGVGLAPVGTVPTAHASASLCSDIVVIAARGSGEDSHALAPDYTTGDHGSGHELWTLFSKLRSLAAKSGETVSLEAAHYPAVGIGFLQGDAFLINIMQLTNSIAPLFHIPGFYTASVADGSLDIARRINHVASTCPTSKIVLSGYSQGVQATGEGLALLSSGPRSHIAASAFFGDPKFDPNDSKATLLGGYLPDHSGLLGTRIPWSAALSSPVFSYCHAWDPICNGNSWVGPVHFHDFARLYAQDLYTQPDQKFSFKALWKPHDDYADDGATDWLGHPVGNAVADAVTRLASTLGLDLPPAPRPPTDTAFVIDSTGSMRDEIVAVRQNVDALANAVAYMSKSFRFALVDFKDIPSEDSPYIARVDTPFTSDMSTFQASVAQVTAEGGGDTPEMQYSGVMTALRLSWRKDVRKSVVVITDAPAKDPEPQSGLTLGAVTKAALALDPAQIYGVAVNGADRDAVSSLNRTADANGGSVSVSSDTGHFVSDLESVLERAGATPRALLSAGTSPVAGFAVPFSASATGVDPRDPVVDYTWRWGDSSSEGTFDETTAASRVTHVYSSPGTYTASVEVTTKSGLRGLATTTVRVTAAPAGPPEAPTGLAVRSGDARVELAWHPVTDATVYSVVDPSGRSVAGISNEGRSGTIRVPITGLRDGRPVHYHVRAVNVAGQGPASASVTATPRKRPSLAVGATASVGDVLRVRGADFPSGSPVRLSLSTRHGVASLPSVRPDALGRLEAQIVIPTSVQPGRATLSATTADPVPLDRTATARLTVEPQLPLLLRYWWAVAAAALIVGGVLVVVIRLRRRRSPAGRSVSRR